MRHSGRCKLFMTCALLLTLAATGCGGDEDGPSGSDVGAPSITVPDQSGVGDPEPGGTLVYGLPEETNGWDPTTNQWAPWSLIEAKAMFDTLTVFDENGDIQPYLAESFTPNDDFTQWTIKLRAGVTFHNDEPLDASVLAANWDFFRESPLTTRIFDTLDSWAPDPNDPLALVVQTADPWVSFPNAWTTQIGVVMPMERLLGTPAERSLDPIGTGPFVFDSWTTQEKMTVVRNDDYWQEGFPYLDVIEFRIITDPTSLASSLKNGEVDIALLEGPKQLVDFTDNSDFTVWQDPTAETPEQFVMLNTLQEPLDDVRVRRALAHATDKQTIIDTTAEGLRDPANGPYKPESPWFGPSDYPQYNLDEARALVDEYEAEVGPIEFELTVGAGNLTSAETATLLISMWEQVGIDATIRQTEVATMIVEVVGANYDAVVWRQFDSPHPLQESVWWHGDGAEPIGTIGLNFARNDDDEITNSLNAARQAEVPAEELALYQTVQERLGADVPYIWISHIDTAFVAKTDVINVFDYTIPGTELRAAALHNSAHALHQVWRSTAE